MAELGPLPGDPDTVLRDATQYQRTAEAIASAAEQLRGLSTGRYRSDAVDAIIDTAGEAAGTITQAHTRYAEAAQALLDYVGPMREAHDRANALTAANRDLVDRAALIRPQLEEYERQAQLPGPQQQSAMAAADQLRAELTSLQSQMSQAEAEWHAALEMMRRAAAAAAGRVHRGNEFGDLNDSFWDSLGDFFDIVGLIASIAQVILKIVSLVLTVLAVVFAALAVVLPILAVVAGLLFTYAQVANLAIAILALLQFTLNGFHILDLVVAGMAVLAAFGGGALGNALGAAAKSAAAGATTALGEAASKGIGELAQQAVSHALEAATDQVVDGILDLGGDGAHSLYDSISGVGTDFLDTSFADDVSAFTDTMTGIGEKVGADFAEGVQASGLGDLITGAGQLGRAGAGLLGQGYDAAYSVATQVTTAVDGAVSSIQSSIDEASRNALGPLLGDGLDHVSAQFAHDLGGALGGPEAGKQVSDFVSSQLGGVLGAVPGADAVVKPIATGFGDLAQSAYNASQAPHIGAGTSGGSRHG